MAIEHVNLEVHREVGGDREDGVTRPGSGALLVAARVRGLRSPCVDGEGVGGDFLGLYRATGDEQYRRGPDEPFDQALEWDRDGQYFHYLTKWMHALDVVARSTRAARFSRWGRELAARASAAFAYTPPPGGRPRLYWKMSIDLSRPLVPSMGQHDPLDGFVTLVQLQATAREVAASPEGPLLDREIAGLASMLENGDWTTDDPLGLGGLLMDAHRAQQLVRQGAPIPGELLERILEAARVGLSQYAGEDELRRPAATRLAFRELGLAIGLQAAELMRGSLDGPRAGSRQHPGARSALDAVLRHAPLRVRIESFWLEPEHRKAPSWTEHRDINDVMLRPASPPRAASCCRCFADRPPGAPDPAAFRPANRS